MTSQTISETEMPRRPRRVSRATLVRLAKFAVVGGAGVVVNVCLFELVLRIVLPAAGVAVADPPDDAAVLIANLVGVVVSIFTNFMLNDRWTWGDRSKGGSGQWLRRLGKYYALAGIAAGVQLAVTWATYRWGWIHLPLVWSGGGGVLDLERALPVDPRPTLALLTGIGCGMTLNFLASHLWAFRDVETTEHT